MPSNREPVTRLRNEPPETWLISLPFQGEHGIIGSYLLVDEGALTLIDPGPSSTVESLLSELREAGFDPQAITHILLTHIHLDHAGATGTLARLLPEAQIYVHSQGAPHLIDPARVVASASRIYGEKMAELWGEVEAVPAERVHSIDQGSILKLAGRRLEVHYTPGHAVHHVIFFDVHSGELFAGDVAGVRLQDADYVRPPTPPPDLDLEAWFESLSHISRLRPDVLYLGHFGPVREITRHIATLRERLIDWGEIVLQAMRAGKSEEEILAQLMAETLLELLRTEHQEGITRRYDLATNYRMTVQGYMRYWQKKHPERLQS